MTTELPTFDTTTEQDLPDFAPPSDLARKVAAGLLNGNEVTNR